MLLCAEDDDLDLVTLVHLGRLRGLDFEVRPGIEIDDEPLLGALDETPHALLVLVRSEHLSAIRARELKATFALARTDEQDLLAIKFEPRRVGECLETIARRLEQLGSSGEAELPTPDTSTGRLARVGVPIDMELDIDIDVDDQSSGAVPAAYVEFDVTVRAIVTESDDVAANASDSTRAATEPTAIVAMPRRRATLVAGLFGGVGIAASAGLWLALAGAAEDPRAEQVVAPAAIVAVEPVVIEAPEPEPAPAPDEAWPPRDESPSVAPTPLANVIEPEPSLAELAPPPEPPKRRKHKQKRRRR